MEGVSAVDTLREWRQELAREVTRRLYLEMPELMDRYGPRGHARCLEDVNHTLEHLAAAVELGSPASFVAYISWVDELLRARDVPTRELARSLELTEALIGERLGVEAAERVRACLAPAIAALREEGEDV
jgi:hypothetical protein